MDAKARRQSRERPHAPPGAGAENRAGSPDRGGPRAAIGSAGDGHAAWRRIPPAAYVVALLAALFHMAPFWHAQWQTPEGWEFTGTLSQSPDYMQYRTWMRQTRDAGPIVRNKLTPEANEPHLPVFFYWAAGRVSQATGIAPEFVFEYAGGLLAFGFVLLLFVTVRLFLVGRYATWWVFLVILLGGGLTTHLKIAHMIGPIRRSPLDRVIHPVFDSTSFDSSRFAYVYRTLLDTHFLVVYLFTTVALLACYFAVRARSPRRHVLAASLIVAATLIHPYEGVLLLLILLCLAALLHAKRRLDARRGRLLLGWCGGGAVVTLAALAYLQEASGLPLPDWRARDAFVSNVLLGHPIGWAVLGWGLAGYWRKAGTERVFLLAWILGCTIMLLSSPYYPFPDRGATTLQIPLYIAAGLAFFDRFDRVPAWGAALVVLALGASLPLAAASDRDATTFSRDKPFMFLDAEHRATLERLEELASPGDLLLADYFEYRWLVPEFAGRGYHPHFFLTVAWEEKEREATRFFSEATPEERAAFLARESVDFVWVNRTAWMAGGGRYDPDRIGRTAGLRPVHRGSHGTLFRFDESGAGAPPVGGARDEGG